jgi:hypothetical protein
MSTSPEPQPKTSYRKAKPLSVAEAMRTEVYCPIEKKYLISQSTIEEMFAGYNSIFSVFFGVFAGVAGVFWGFWNQCTVEPTKMYYLTFAVVSTVFTVLCGTLFLFGYVRAIVKKRKLYKEAVLIHSN